jgi:hypothetical protein
LKPKKPNRTEPKSKKTGKKPSQNRVKPEKIKPNRFEPVFVQKNRTETGQFEPVSVFLKKNFGWVTFFFIKTESNQK